MLILNLPNEIVKKIEIDTFFRALYNNLKPVHNETWKKTYPRWDQSNLKIVDDTKSIKLTCQKNNSTELANSENEIEKNDLFLFDRIERTLKINLSENELGRFIRFFETTCIDNNMSIFYRYTFTKFN